ncbi:MAG: cobalt-precorrin-5B (C(1))-methyltransferase [Gammaproteobacteria bacterium]
MPVPPRDPKGHRTGYTTGACAAAAAKAAARCLLGDAVLQEIETTLPNRRRVRFPLERCERTGQSATCSILKDAGDDPDCTHGAEIVAEVELRETPGIEIRGGRGVATVTKPGLGLEVGTAAINPVPSRNITEMVEEELSGSPYRGALVTIAVPGGEEMAKKTTNTRLGLLGGISILGTTGIVKPYSTAAWRASVVQEIDVAAAAGERMLVLTTGGKSEQYAMALYPELPEAAFIQVGDFIGVGVRHCARRGIHRAVVVGMMGKLSKMAKGKMQTHAAGSEVDMGFLASLAAELGGSAALLEDIGAANTARHVLDLCREAGLIGITTLVCRKVAEHCTRHAGGELEVGACLVDFGGGLLGRYPEAVS